MALDPLCLCFFSICIITCWRCFLPFRLAMPIMHYPLYIVTLKTNIMNEIEDNNIDYNISKNSGDSKNISDVTGSKTEKTPNLNQRCYTDYEEYSKGDYFSYKEFKYGSLVQNVLFSNPKVKDLKEVKTEDMNNAKSDIKYYSNRETKNDYINASTNTCSSSTETLTKSRNIKNNCAYKWVRNKKSELCDLASKGRSYLKKCTQNLRIKNTIHYRNRK